MGSSEAGTWLHQSLLHLCSDPSSVVRLDPDVITSLVSYCELAPPSDAAEYIRNMIGDENCKDIVTEYLGRRGVSGSPEDEDFVQDTVMHVYVKPQQMDENWSIRSKRTTKNSKSRTTTEGKVSSVDSSDGHSSSGSGLKGKGGGSKLKKGGKGIPLSEAAEGRMLFSKGAPCTCQASRHKLVNNCLSCGKIVCEQEGEGPCSYCGALVLREGSTYAGLEGAPIPVSDAEAAAQAFKDRLVQYGLMSSQRTTVIDDQSDYFQIDGNAWLSEEEKQALQYRQQELELAEEARKKKVVVSIDLLGRRVIIPDDSDSEISSRVGILEGDALNRRFSSELKVDPEGRFTNAGIKPNPYLSQIPIFVDVKQSKDSKRKQGASLHGEKFARVGRVQHDDPLVSANEFSILQGTGVGNNDDVWHNRKIKERISQCQFEDEGCLLDATMNQSGASPYPAVFDICESQRRELFSLSPSSLVLKQAERREARNMGSEPANILMPGMVLLKHFLSQSEQVEIVKECRNLGAGPGGFYQPGYGNENKMHFWMMCLGWHWEPATRLYEVQRPCDNATPPGIPSLFLNLVDKCLNMARDVFQAENRSNGSKRNTDLLPRMNPNVCLVNFYELYGRLGMHQDRDESQESLKNGVPVVSFSIGDSADFLYGSQRDVDMAQNVILESGDVLIFGGPARMIFHGVPHIHPHTAPSWLINKTNMRPGRLNLTFRQL